MSPMEGGVMPKPSEQAKAAFTRLVPGRPMKAYVTVPPKVPAAKKAGVKKLK